MVKNRSGSKYLFIIVSWIAFDSFTYRKGSLEPIKVVVKIRQGRKASTLITGFEPFVVVDADEMAEDLRKACAGSTSG